MRYGVKSNGFTDQIQKRVCDFALYVWGFQCADGSWDFPFSIQKGSGATATTSALETFVI
jgi:hypothetical protein